MPLTDLPDSARAFVRRRGLGRVFQAIESAASPALASVRLLAWEDGLSLQDADAIVGYALAGSIARPGRVGQPGPSGLESFNFPTEVEHPTGRYRYRIRVVITDPKTGEVIHRELVHDSDHLLDESEEMEMVNDAVESWREGSSERYGDLFSEVSYQVRAITQI